MSKFLEKENSDHGPSFCGFGRVGVHDWVLNAGSRLFQGPSQRTSSTLEVV